MRELISNLLLVGSFLILSPIAFMHSSTAHAQNRLITLADARQELAVPAYTASERSLLAEQGLFTIENLFVHRELKIADFGQGHDPVPPLEDLVRDAATLDNRQFHNRITQIFTTLHDLHTNYIAPAPRSCGIPFIPLFLEGVLLGDEEVIVVSGKTQAGSELTEDVQRGMQLVSVNDRPVEQVLGELMLVSGGANAAAMRFRAIQLLTFRGSQVELPAEDQMKMKFLQEGLETEVTIPWLSMMLDSCLNENEDSESTEESLSLDIAMNMAQNEFQKEFNKVFDKNNLIKEKPPLTDIIVEEFQERFNEVYRHSNNESAEAPEAEAPEAEAPEAAAPPAWSKVFTAEVLNTPAGKLGYINLKSFYWDDPNLDASTVVEAFRRTLEIGLVGVDSLVIDIRNNPGGLITFSEELVQLFAPQGVDPTTVRMLANPLNEKIFIKSNGSENRWSHAIRKAIDNGQKYMEPLAITPPTEANMMGQVWFKPVVVLTNAGCYSACDLFSAGMQDSGAATIIGVHSTTGAGGANVMEYSTFQQIMGNGSDNPFVELPFGQNLRVSWRQTIRSGVNQGQLIEDIGVESDLIVRKKYEDIIMGESRNLMLQIHTELDRLKPNFKSSVASKVGGMVFLDNRQQATWTENITGADELKVISNGLTVASFDLSDTVWDENLVDMDIPGVARNWQDKRFALEGFLDGRQVFRVVRELRWRGDFLNVPEDGITASFDDGDLGPFKAVSLTGEPGTGWQIVDGKLRVGNGPEYGGRVLTRAYLPIKLNGDGGRVSFDIFLDAESGNDSLRIYTVNPDTSARVELYSGTSVQSNGAAIHTGVTLPKEWDRVELVFEFESDENWNMRGPELDNFTISQ